MATADKMTKSNHEIDSNKSISEKSESSNPSLLPFIDKNHPMIQYFENLLSRNVQPKGKSSFLVFKGGKYTTIQTKDIAYFFINNDTPTIMSFDKTMYPITLSLDEVNKLIAASKFFRINRQYLISFSAIKEVEHYFSRKLIVKLKCVTTEKLFVGKDKATAFLSWLENR